MANHKSALKEHRRSVRRRTQNRLMRARTRTAIKQYRAALASGDVEAARGMLGPTLSLVDRSAKIGAIHTNAADRTKSRLSRALNRAAG